MSDRKPNGRFAEGHSIGPRFGEDHQPPEESRSGFHKTTDPVEAAKAARWTSTRERIKEQYPTVWDKYAIEGDGDE